VFKKLSRPINLIILAGLWLVACNYNPSYRTAEAAARAGTETSTLTPASTSTATRRPSTATSTGASTSLPAVTPTYTPQATDMPATAIPTQTPSSKALSTVFVIVMENTNWSEIKDSDSAPYLNNVLLPIAAHAEAYYNPPGVHPSEPNYLWLEAGTDFGITNDANPDANHQSTSMHLVTLLDQMGISWKSYQEDISGTDCPLTATGLYAPKHNPMVYFDDVTDINNPNSPDCIAHIRPASELSTDLQNNTVAQYNFIVPNLCNDMHGSLWCLLSNRIQNGDDWLANNVPNILNSPAYANGGVLFITWDEGSGGSDGPIGLLVLSPKAKGGGYSNTIHYTHSSLLRTIQEIFGVTPLLGDAAQATNLSDLFVTFPN
jgi:hypothetical protein